ncbi:hypothetical protein [Vulcanisaeta moutnovskia]|uniref:hypothetical protein n=1 Tax=Vulcanisaeta moutnovskia TaxID=985052 RepID=UPI00064F02B3|nr:hypothetical protein [Vulcanisaeta moutnovskia]
MGPAMVVRLAGITASIILTEIIIWSGTSCLPHNGKPGIMEVRIDFPEIIGMVIGISLLINYTAPLILALIHQQFLTWPSIIINQHAWTPKPTTVLINTLINIAISIAYALIRTIAIHPSLCEDEIEVTAI